MLLDALWSVGTDTVMCGWCELTRNGISWTVGDAWAGMSNSADTHCARTSPVAVAIPITRRGIRAPTGWQRTHATVGAKATVR